MPLLLLTRRDKIGIYLFLNLLLFQYNSWTNYVKPSLAQLSMGWAPDDDDDDQYSEKQQQQQQQQQQPSVKKRMFSEKREAREKYTKM